MIWIAVISFFAILAWDVITDYRKWLKHHSVDHGAEAWLRILLMIVPTVFFCIAHTPEFDIWVLTNVGFMQFFTFWLLFDGLYNKLRGYGWWFAGSDDQDDPFLDDLIQKYPKLAAILKVAGAVIFITIYILTYAGRN